MGKPGYIGKPNHIGMLGHIGMPGHIGNPGHAHDLCGRRLRLGSLIAGKVLPSYRVGATWARA